MACSDEEDAPHSPGSLLVCHGQLQGAQEKSKAAPGAPLLHRRAWMLGPEKNKVS